ncbi:MAG: class I SAM-dependent methyltransferase [Verrucomicrobiota bacterium]
MQKEKITAIFDQQAASYDQKWSKLAPINGALHLLTGAVLSELPATARILCVGAGTGAEMIYLAEKFPGWRFTAVEPSTAMLEVLLNRAEERGISSRCVFHAGYLDTLPAGPSFDAATALLVSQFILDRAARSEFFGSIAARLRPEGILISSDLAGDMSSAADDAGLLEVWFQVMRDSGSLSTPEEIGKMREAYTRDVAVLPPGDIRDIIASGGFDSPVGFFQAGMIHAWYARRSTGKVEEGAV